MSYQAIEVNRSIGSVDTLCRALDVSVSGYYAWGGPFREYAEEHLNTSKVGLVHMIAADQVYPEGNKGQRDFIKRNGILVPFYTDRFTFNDIDVPRANEELLRRARLAA